MGMCLVFFQTPWLLTHVLPTVEGCNLLEKIDKQTLGKY